MLTVRFDTLGVQPGDLVLDMGCGAGRHAFEAYRLGARMVAFDYSAAELKDVSSALKTKKGFTYSHRFTKKGTFKISCQVHPNMHTTVKVS